MSTEKLANLSRDALERRVATLHEELCTLQQGHAAGHAALRRERDRVGLYLDIVGSIVVVLDRSGCISLINRMGCEVIGLPEDELRGADWFDTVIPEDQRRDVKDVFAQLIDGNVEPIESYENTIISHDGAEHRVTWRNTVLHDDDGHIVGTLSSGQDVTQQRRMEAALRQSERLQAAGTLAETVSQNFGNVLNAIGGYATFLVDSLIPDTRAHRSAQRIVDATQHATELTRRLMNVARVNSTTDRLEVEPIHLGDALRRTLTLLDHVFAQHNVKVTVKAMERMPYVEADIDQLIDVLMSILTNSAEAMPGGGTITIDKLERRISRPRSNPRATGGVFVGLRLRDNGVGMSRSVQQRIFEPFFTTKGTSASFGLGLPVAQSVTQAMGGWISVGSREGKGTVFRVFLRKAETQPSEATEQLGSGQDILLIDDSETDLALMRAALEGEGHTVHAVADEKTALDTFDQHREALTCAVVDFMMNTPTGTPLLEHILQRNPKACVVVTSGFSRDYIRDRVSRGAWTFLQKPFTSKQLVDVLTEAVNRG